jgi:hypothetical protein
MLSRLARAELIGERADDEEWPQARGDGALKVCVRQSAQFGLGGRKHRMRSIDRRSLTSTTSRRIVMARHRITDPPAATPIDFTTFRVPPLVNRG